MGRIVVGIDGSESSYRALEWAAREAKIRDATLYLVHSWQFSPAAPDPAGGIRHIDIEGVAKKIVDDAIATLDEESAVETEIANDSAGRALVRASRGADLVVVGARGLGGFRGLLLGSVSQLVAHHAHCPIVIVPNQASETPQHSDDALQLASRT
jgi:nucleotide-binding universal stress UspA family protein